MRPQRSGDEVRAAVDAATTPAARLALALASPWLPSMPARPKAVREFQLDDVDRGNRRLALAGRARPLDDLTDGSERGALARRDRAQGSG
ncbi:hypothetical protein [Streptomyces bobili]|uniref:Uncharacterized protein n=1 Tax=Streptomyces bobili TaxID=67280 RepID=A0ABZ1RAL7_9ACTN|nr:hypothetical protein [Streptomyces bobili]